MSSANLYHNAPTHPRSGGPRDEPVGSRSTWQANLRGERVGQPLTPPARPGWRSLGPCAATPMWQAISCGRRPSHSCDGGPCGGARRRPAPALAATRITRIRATHRRERERLRGGEIHRLRANELPATIHRAALKQVLPRPREATPWCRTAHARTATGRMPDPLLSEQTRLPTRHKPRQLRAPAGNQHKCLQTRARHHCTTTAARTACGRAGDSLQRAFRHKQGCTLCEHLYTSQRHRAIKDGHAANTIPVCMAV